MLRMSNAKSAANGEIMSQEVVQLTKDSEMQKE
jgi:hypothetical protein